MKFLASTLVGCAALLLCPNSFGQGVGPDTSSPLGAFNRKGLVGDFTYKCSVQTERKPHSEEETEKFRERLKAQKASPQVIEKLATMFKEGQARGDAGQMYVHVVSHGEAVKYYRTADAVGVPRAVDYLSPTLICTGLPGGATGLTYSMDRSNLYASPNTVGQRFLPWFLGVFPLDRLFTGDVVHTSQGSDQVFRKRFQMEPRRSVTIEAIVGPDGKPEKMQAYYGIAKKPSDVCTVSEWTTKGGYLLPKKVQIETINIADDSVAQTIFLDLVSSRIGANEDASDLDSLGPQGAEVIDCRLGQESCVRYKIGPKPLTDDEVRALVDQQRPSAHNVALPKTKPYPSDPPVLMVTGLGIFGVAMLTWVCIRVVTRK